MTLPRVEKPLFEGLFLRNSDAGPSAWVDAPGQGRHSRRAQRTLRAEWVEFETAVSIDPEVFDTVQDILVSRRPSNTSPRVVNGAMLPVGVRKPIALVKLVWKLELARRLRVVTTLRWRRAPSDCHC